MDDFKPTEEQEKSIDALVAHYLANQGPVKRFLESLHVHISESESLAHLIHSVKRRMKSPASLKDKLIRKLEKDLDAGQEFHINAGNLFTEITDLGGYRILHLHTTQMDSINKALRQTLDEAQCEIFDGPKANVWDTESESYFKSIDVDTEYNPRMYTSVHYTVMPAKSTVIVRAEIQVRTLSEEIWGEVDHRFNYPHAIDSVACGEQIKVLARVASSCTRLVDSIFASHADWKESNRPAMRDGPAPDRHEAQKDGGEATQAPKPKIQHP